MKLRHFACASTLTLVAAIHPALANAQDATSASADATSQPEVADDSRLDVIVVTAQRISEPLQRVPVSVQTVDAEELDARKLNDLLQLQLAVPSLQVAAENSLSLRGIGSQVFSQSVDSSVGVAVDDVSLGVPSIMGNGLLDDVAQIEVLMGPQGLLFGRNASAGLMNVVTQRPVLGETSGRLYTEFDYRDTVPGDKQGVIAKGTVNLPLGDVAALRLNGFYDDQDSIASVVARQGSNRLDEGRERFGGRAKLLVEPDDRLNIYVVGDYAEESGIGGSQDRTFRAFGPGSVSQVFAGLDGVTAGPENLEFGVSGASYRDLKTGGASVSVGYELSDDLNLTNVLAYREYSLNFALDTDYTSFDGVDVNEVTSDYDQLSNELRLAFMPNEFIDGQAGLYYFKSRRDGANVVGAGAFGALGPFNSQTLPVIGSDSALTIENESYAAFTQVNLHPTDDLTLVAGGRLTRDEVSIDLVQNQVAYPIPLGVPNVSTSDQVENDDFSWKVGAQYQVTPDVMAYVSYGKGYKGPTFNDSLSFVGQDLAVGPETVKNLEAGLKSTFFDERVRLNLAAFHQEFEDFQVQGFDAVSSTFYTSNAAELESTGVEILAEGRVTPELTLSASATVLDSTFASYPNDRCYPGQTTCSPSGTTDSTGNRTPGSAKFTSTLAATYERPLSDTVNLIVSGNYYHRSSVNYTSNANPGAELGPIDVFGFNIGAEIDDRYRVSLFCKNCTDEVFPTAISSDAIDSVLLNVNTAAQYWGYNSVRTIGVSLDVQF